MLAIKLQRIGKKHQPSYRLVVAEKKSKMAGPPVEDLGSYSTTTKMAHLNADRVKYWLGVGAQPTLTVHNLLVREKISAEPKIQMIFKVPEKAPAAEAKPAEVAPVAVAASAEGPASEPAPAEAPAEAAQ
jgi:small subunit ribosomal protein S16